MRLRRESRRSRWPVSALLWAAGSLALLAPPLIRWLDFPAPIRFPVTPVDYTNVLYARQWALAQKALQKIPAGQSYTTMARDEDEEMLLFMLSLGLLTKQLPMPSSYQGIDRAVGAEARYVVAYECLEPEGARLVHRFPEGCLWERPEMRP